VTPTDLTIAAELTGRVRLGMLALEGVEVREGDDALAAEIASHCEELRARFATAHSAEVPGADEARALYKALGLDPTKTRPSSEALLRRVLKGEALYRVNTLVDAANLASLRAQLPFGLYDRDQVSAPVVLRKGASGEGYEGIRKAHVNLEDRPVLADAAGAFGNPSSDSARAMIRAETRRALVVVYAPARLPPGRLDAVLDDTAATLTRHCRGTVAARGIVG
jgi:DNA/RNA-binding domain of Phe-tRNA-synthetase-like protein